MGRIKLDPPEEFSFYTIIPVRITDINYGGHVGNDTILTLLHEARMQFLQHHHFSEMDFFGVGLIMSDVAIEFKKEVFYKDLLTVHVTLVNFTRIGFDVFYKMIKGDETIVALAKTGMVCYNYKEKKIVSLPQKVQEIFS